MDDSWIMCFSGWKGILLGQGYPIYFPNFGFLLVCFGTAFGLLHKNQKKGKRSLGEG